MYKVHSLETITANSAWGKWLLIVTLALGVLMANASMTWADDDDDDDDHGIVGTWRVTILFHDDQGNVVGTDNNYGVFHSDGTFVETSAGTSNTSAGVGVWERIEGHDEGDDDDDDGNGNIYSLTFEVFADIFPPLDGVTDSVLPANATLLVQGDKLGGTVSGPLLSVDGEDVIIENALAGATAVGTRVNVIPE